MDPIIGTIVSALVAGVVAAIKPTAEQAIKDTYAGIKALIRDRYQINLSNLEENPESKVQAAAIEEALAQKNAQDDPELIEQANTIADLVQRTDPSAAETVGVDLERVKVGIAKFRKVRANAGATGVRAKDSEFDQLDFEDVEAGSDPKNP